MSTARGMPRGIESVRHGHEKDEMDKGGKERTPKERERREPPRLRMGGWVEYVLASSMGYFLDSS